MRHAHAPPPLPPAGRAVAVGEARRGVARQAGGVRDVT
jgi:hypothetical protein